VHGPGSRVGITRARIDVERRVGRGSGGIILPNDADTLDAGVDVDWINALAKAGVC
jgi:hypothetical protein